MENDDINFKSNFLFDHEVKKRVIIFVFLRIKPIDSMGDTNKTIVQHNNNDSNKNGDVNFLSESVSAIQDEVNIINDIIKDKKQKSTKSVPTYQL